jgi:general secretion pathway protein K
MPVLAMEFPSGSAVVQIIPETAKLNINLIRPEELLMLLVALGAEPGRAREIALAIVDWRSAVPGGLSVFDQHYLSLTPSFRARHASFQEIEELLLVKGMTPDLFYGTFIRDPQGRLLPQAGLRDCVSVYGSTAAVDANYAAPPVLAAVGLPPAAIEAIAQRRHASPFLNRQELSPFLESAGPAAVRLTLGGNSIFTLRATARLRLPNGQHSDLRRTVSALLKFHIKPVDGPPVDVLRWYDN